MKILAIDTTSRFLCIGAYDGKTIYEYNLDAQTRHSALLVISIKRILDCLHWQVPDVDYFACAVGPGSFTGMRVGLSTIKGLAWASNRGIVGVSSLDLIAQNALPTKAKQVIPVIDAKRNLVYYSIYASKKESLKRIIPYRLSTLDELIKKIKPGSVLLGDALGLYKDKIQKTRKGAFFLDKDYWYPRPDKLLDIALEKIRKKKVTNAFAVKPIYLYPKECQVKK